MTFALVPLVLIVTAALAVAAPAWRAARSIRWSHSETNETLPGSWLWRVPLAQEVDEEIAHHIDLKVRELVAHGMDAASAREEVLARFGDMDRVKRTCMELGRKRDREMRLTQRLEELRDDVTYAFRQMKATPGFTIVAALTLALGIGANSAIFALADATFLRPLPFTTPHDRLFMLWKRYPNGFLSQTTPLDYKDWTEQNRSFDAMAAFLFDNAALIGPMASLSRSARNR